MISVANRESIRSLGTWLDTVAAHIEDCPPECNILYRPIARVHLSRSSDRNDSLPVRAFFWAWAIDIQIGQWLRNRLRCELSAASEIDALFAQLLLGPGRLEAAPFALVPTCTDCGRPTGAWCDGCEDGDYPSQVPLTARRITSPSVLRPLCSRCERKNGQCGLCNLWQPAWAAEERTSRYRETFQPDT